MLLTRWMAAGALPHPFLASASIRSRPARELRHLLDGKPTTPNARDTGGPGGPGDAQKTVHASAVERTVRSCRRS
jgi:hypothetical protein